VASPKEGAGGGENYGDPERISSSCTGKGGRGNILKSAMPRLKKDTLNFDKKEKKTATNALLSEEEKKGDDTRSNPRWRGGGGECH